MIRTWGPAVLIAAAMMSGAAKAQLADLREAVVVVQAVGPDPSRGNAKKIVYGTGFYINRLGYVVTAAHLAQMFGPEVAPDDITFSIADDASGDAVKRIATVFQSDPVRDVMVLWSPPDRPRKVVPAPPLTMDAVQLAQTPVFTAGFPAGLGFNVRQGRVTAFQGAVEPPDPNWVTDFEFKAGQSGSPVYLASGALIGIVKGVDSGAPTFGQIVPATAVPAQVIELSTVPLADGRKPRKLHIWLSYEVPQTETRPAALPWAQNILVCEPPASKPLTAPPGWSIRLDNIRLDPQPRSEPVQVVLANGRPVLSVVPQPQRCGFGSGIFKPKGFVSVTAQYDVTLTTQERRRIAQVHTLQGSADPTRIDVSTPPPVQIEIEAEGADGALVRLDAADVVSKGVVDVLKVKQRIGVMP